MTKLAGLLLIAAGVLALVYGGIPYTTHEKVLDLGPLQASADRQRTLVIPPYVGAGVVGFGALLMLIPGRRKQERR